MRTKEEVDLAVESIRNSAPYWAPEARAEKLAVYLMACGRKLELRLLAWSVEEQKICGLTAFRDHHRKILSAMLETGTAPRPNKMAGSPADEVRAFARKGIASMQVDEMLVRIGAEQVALSFSIRGSGTTTMCCKVGTVEEVLGAVERLALRYELGGLDARAATPGEVSGVEDP